VTRALQQPRPERPAGLERSDRELTEPLDRAAIHHLGEAIGEREQIDRVTRRRRIDHRDIEARLGSRELDERDQVVHARKAAREGLHERAAPHPFAMARRHLEQMRDQRARSDGRIGRERGEPRMARHVRGPDEPGRAQRIAEPARGIHGGHERSLTGAGERDRERRRDRGLADAAGPDADPRPIAHDRPP